MYSAPAGEAQKSALAARLFGFVDFYSSVIRFYAAYHIREPGAYTLATATYAIMLVHFGSEWFVFRTARRKEVLPAFVSLAVGLGWMTWWRGWYLDAQ